MNLLNIGGGMVADIFKRAGSPFPKSLSDMQKMFPDDAACAAYLEQNRWPQGFACPTCGARGEPFRFAARPGVVRCRTCRKDTALTVDTVMERSHTPLTVWFSAAHLLVTHSGGLNARQFQSQLGLSRYATVFQILHKLRSRMAPPANERLGAEGRSVAAVWVGESINLDGKTSIELSRAIAVVEMRTEDENKGTDSARRHTSRLPERMRLHVMPNRSAIVLVGFIADHVTPGTKVVTGDDSVDRILTTNGYKSFGEADSLERNECLTTARLVAAQLQHHLDRHHRGVSKQHLQAYLDEFSFRLNHASHPDKAFRTLLGMGTPC